MENFAAGRLVELVHSLAYDTLLGRDDKAPLDDFIRASIVNNLKDIREQCETMGLLVSVDHARTGIRLLEESSGIAGETGAVSRMCAILVTAMRIEMEARKFYSVRPERLRFQEPAFWGESFITGFPSAAFEAGEAGKCLLFGRETGCVFHLMRLMETCIRALARCLAIDDPLKPAQRNWGFILAEIKKGIDAKWPTQAERFRGDGQLFEGLYVSLDAVRNPWRNATMHVENKYTYDEAEHVIIAVRGFASKLAARMDESGEPKA